MVSGDIAIAGNHATDEAVGIWAKRFSAVQPGVTIRLRNDTKLTTDAFEAAIAQGDIDLVPSARELVPAETERLTQKLGGPPLVIGIATGSYATKSGTHALAFYVNEANPLARITLTQLREIYTPGGTITKWGQLGLSGEWAERPIHVFSVQISDPNGNPLGIINYLQNRVFKSTRGLRRSIYQVDSNGPKLEQHMLYRIVRQVADDRDAIGFSGFGFGAPGAKTLALAETGAGPWYTGTHSEVADRRYPLTRTIYFGVNQPVGHPLRPAVREFLLFVLSREGQEPFAEGVEKYLPLTADFAAAERAKLP
jgi:phosphate transport system substrate-binding protein